MSLRNTEHPKFCSGCILQLSFATTQESAPRSRQRAHAGYQQYESANLEWFEDQLAEGYYTISNLEKRREKGCQLCTLILRAFTEEEACLRGWKHIPRTTAPERHRIEPQHSNKPKKLTLDFDFSLGAQVSVSNEAKVKEINIDVVEVKQRGNLPIATLRSSLYHDWRNESSASTSSAPSIDQISIWIEHCKHSHDCYKDQRQGNFLPTRLVKLERGTEKLRLCSSKDLPPETYYATLSHCWGEKPFMRLLKGNLTSFSNDIPFLDLPQTFQDAVTVLSKLFVKYIWIDSLCIIQDSGTDWEFEAARMSQVYANSYLNLAATASRNSAEGLFRTRNPSSIRECRYVPDEGRRNMHVRPSSPEWECVNPSEWVTSIVEAPLNSRAWVYQERALAPRVLHFAASEIYWECNHMRASETYPDGLPAQYIIPKQKNLLYNYSRQEKANLAHPKDTLTEAISLGKFLGTWINQSDNTPLDLWTLIVEDYSSAQLTYATDKLVAISALAQTFAQDYPAKHIGPL